MCKPSTPKPVYSGSVLDQKLTMAQSLHRLLVVLALVFLASILCSCYLQARSKPNASTTTSASSWQFRNMESLSSMPPVSLLELPRPRAYVRERKYLMEPEPVDMAWQLTKVKAFIRSRAFAKRQKERRKAPERGIVINGGGPTLLTSAIILLKVLREQLNCTLPVSLYWHGPHEMDPQTFKYLKQQFGPLDGEDIQAAEYPRHHRRLPPEQLRGFRGKVFSLLLAPYQEVILMDADVLPMNDPAQWFSEPHYLLGANMFWPDYWEGGVQEVVYEMVGLQEKPLKDVLAQGRGGSARDAESGVLLLDLRQHADVVELLHWINSYGDRLYPGMYGDKDTFSMAFGAAGKAHLFTMVGVPPGGMFAWRQNSLVVKKDNTLVPGWQLIGMVQHHPLGHPMFVHRTMNKFSTTGEAWRVEVMTGPLTYKWIQFYLAQYNLGPTRATAKGPFVVPREAIVPYHQDPSQLEMSMWQAGNTYREAQHQHGSVLGLLRSPPAGEVSPTCHEPSVQNWMLRYMGLPLGAPPVLSPMCRSALLHCLGQDQYQVYDQLGYLDHPEALRLLMAPGGDGGEGDAGFNADPFDGENQVERPNPAAGWQIQYEPKGFPSTPTRDVLIASHAASSWVMDHLRLFKTIAEGAQRSSHQRDRPAKADIELQ